jgi:hypothetical protein
MPFRDLTLWVIVAPQEAVFSLDIETYNLLFLPNYGLLSTPPSTLSSTNSCPPSFVTVSCGLCGLKRNSRADLHLGRKGTFNVTSSTTTTNCSSGLQEIRADSTSRKQQIQENIVDSLELLRKIKRCQMWYLHISLRRIGQKLYYLTKTVSLMVCFLQKLNPVCRNGLTSVRLRVNKPLIMSVINDELNILYQP